VAGRADNLRDALDKRAFHGEGGVPAGASGTVQSVKNEKVIALFGMGDWVLDKY
jgi:hypothetical protein